MAACNLAVIYAYIFAKLNQNYSGSYIRNIKMMINLGQLREFKIWSNNGYKGSTKFTIKNRR